MADEADVAEQSSVILIDVVIDRIRASAGIETPPANGRCLWCDNEIGAGRRFCDADCRDDFDRFSRGTTCQD